MDPCQSQQHSDARQPIRNSSKNTNRLCPRDDGPQLLHCGQHLPITHLVLELHTDYLTSSHLAQKESKHQRGVATCPGQHGEQTEEPTCELLCS